jgi:small-conductance mechanosensitive channel
MSRTSRRSTQTKAQLLAIMQAHRDRATCLREFSRQAIAQEAGVTPQYVSMLIGSEYRAAAQGLNGKRRSVDTPLRQALAENQRLRKELRNAHHRLEELARQSIDDALRLIDQLDEDNRLLRGRVRVLEQRLRQQEIVVTPDKRVPTRPRPTLGLVPTEARQTQSSRPFPLAWRKSPQCQTGRRTP